MNRSITLLFLILPALCFSQGLVFDDDVYDNAPIKAKLTRGEGHEVPASFSIKQYCPRPGNQLQYGTSVAWAVAWQARTILYAKEHDITDASELTKHIFAPSYIYQLAKKAGDEECMEGITLKSGLEVVKERGVPRFKDFLFFCGGNINENINEKAKENKVSGYSKLFYRSDKPAQKILRVKKALSEGLPVIIGVISPPSLKRAKEFWQPTEQPKLNHGGQAMCIVSYDDEKFGGAFEVVNSWGKDWGNDGFIWIRYSDFGNFVKYAYEMFVIPKTRTAKLGGEVKLKLSNGEEMPVKSNNNGYYKMKEVYTSGTNFRVYVKTEDPSFVYVFGSDLTNKCFPIFPHQQSVSAAVTYKHDQITIPDENHFIQFDDTAGTDYLCILYSREELDFKSALDDIENASGSFPERVQKVFSSELLNGSIQWAEDYISFSSTNDKGSIIAAVVEIEHK